MDKINLFTASDLAKITKYRSGVIKFGEKMLTVPKNQNTLDFIKNCKAKYVLLGIPEDIGIRANAGNHGAALVWDYAVSNLVNLQHNKYCKGDDILLLGTIDVRLEMKEVEKLDIRIPENRIKMNGLVNKVDKEVTNVIYNLIKLGKIPIIIGGGQNNAYGNIKGTALAKGKPINAINFDALSDFRILEGRSNINGFSYAYEEGFLNKYFVFGLHESYISKSALDRIKKTEGKIAFNTYDEINIRRSKNFDYELQRALDFIKDESYGIEIDLGAIPLIPSSLTRISGFSVEELRIYINHIAKNKNATYLHICEGKATADEDKDGLLIGMLISKLITDFIKSNKNDIAENHDFTPK
jgi:formiminoglutamase